MPRIEVDANRCKACYLCVNTCPKKCLGKSKTISKKGYFPAEMVNPQDCIGCTMCYMGVPGRGHLPLSNNFKRNKHGRKNITQGQ